MTNTFQAEHLILREPKSPKQYVMYKKEIYILQRF